MRELNEIEIQEVNGGFLPLVIIAGKALVSGFSMGVAAYGLYFIARSAE